ncbi:MAG: hypothetical protein HFJ10_03895 [Lachnospiraceae bacterium]|jgi:hypothetical protein|nr:hypothetical protein [Lachnospiraceae bacterium]
MNWIDKLEKKFGRYAIHNLMYYVIILYAIGFVVQITAPEFYMMYLSLDPTAIVRGQIWRMFTFIIYPPNTSMFFFLISMYLYYSIGKTLEYQWGSFRFNLYFFTGVVLHIVAAFICQYVFGMNLGTAFGTYYLNYSLFFAFAATYPEMQFMLFFLIPIKAKWLGIINGIYFGVTILAGFFANYLPVHILYGLLQVGIIAFPAYSVMALVSLGNFLIFFFGMRNMRRYSPKEAHRRHVYTKSVKQGQKSAVTHKCAICGRTEKDGDHLEFRYCSKCNGNYEYCQEHLFTHTHVK